METMEQKKMKSKNHGTKEKEIETMEQKKMKSKNHGTGEAG